MIDTEPKLREAVDLLRDRLSSLVLPMTYLLYSLEGEEALSTKAFYELGEALPWVGQIDIALFMLEPLRNGQPCPDRERRIATLHAIMNAETMDDVELIDAMWKLREREERENSP